MSVSAASPATPPDQAQDAWRAIRQSGDLQFAPVPDWAPPPTPDWMKALSRFLRDLFEPLGRALGLSWPVVEKILLVLLVLGVALLLWRIGVMVRRRFLRPRAPGPAIDPTWRPQAHDARALLEEADALAARGCFDEAAHLLLLRSLDHIAAARPDALSPAATAREIAALAFLTGPARDGFARIAALVEQGRYALRPLCAEDWHTARAAYAGFSGQNWA